MPKLRKIILLLCFFLITNSFSQKKQLLYNFAELPQTLLLNPGAETNFNYHMGVPLLSGISTEIGSSGFSLSDIFSVDNRTINDKISQIVESLSSNDYVQFNVQLDLFNAGFRLNNNTYISFGFYGELDGIIYTPKDLLVLATEGNYNYLNKSFQLSHGALKIDALGVLHVGFTKKVNENLTFGSRFKIYSSVLNAESLNNYGTFTTRNGSNNVYAYYLDNANLKLRTSGLIEGENQYIENAFFGDNMGIGFDVGFTYHISDQIEVTGSVVDVGFIKYSKLIQNASITGSYKYEGVAYEYDPENPSSFVELIGGSFREEVTTVQNEESYVSLRPAKVNASFAYSFGMKRSIYCFDNTFKDFFSNTLGVQMHAVHRPLSIQHAFTGFYQRMLSQRVHTKVTYTIDNYSSNNIGVGLSAQVGKLNFYGMVDNILQFTNIAAANSISAQLGFNLIF